MSRKMNDVKQKDLKEKMPNERSTEKNSKGKSKGKRGSKVKDRGSRETTSSPNGVLDKAGKNNDPNWYFTDAALAEQVSQMSMQQLAGFDIDVNASIKIPVASIVIMYLNPSPGVVLAQTPYLMKQNSGINLAGFKLFSKLSAFTGRTASYGPQDISTMILSFGELISRVEWCRRAFGVAYTMNMRNRDYPKKILQAMGIDADDFMRHYADYRTYFNTIVTLVNQLPIPANIKYFEKCASLYEKIYLDAPSDMAQTIIPTMATTWNIDETTYAGGTVLKTADWQMDKTAYWTVKPVKNFAFFLDDTMSAIKDMLNSSTLQVVYTDLLNLAVKQSSDANFWKFDYLSDGYMVLPEYNPNFLLQFHNLTATSMPKDVNDETHLTDGITPFNDVYPDPNDNALIYNPGFRKFTTGSKNRTAVPFFSIVDYMNDTPSVEDRVDVTRMISLSGRLDVSSNTDTFIDMALPDHYVVCNEMWSTDGSSRIWGSYMNSNDTVDNGMDTWSVIDWAPRIYLVDANTGAWKNEQIGDLNYYTVIQSDYLRRLHDFVALGLYDMR